MKPIRKAVRTFLINDNKVIALKYTTENNNGFYDIPGGKIEDNETSVDAAIREFKEETTMDIRDYYLNLDLLKEKESSYKNFN